MNCLGVMTALNQQAIAASGEVPILECCESSIRQPEEISDVHVTTISDCVPLLDSILAAKNPTAEKQADLIVGNTVFSVYIPNISNALSVRDGIFNRVASGQTGRIVIDLRLTNLTEKEIQEALLQHPIPRLVEIYSIHRIFP